MRKTRLKNHRLAMEPLEGRLLLRASPVLATITLHTNFGDIPMEMLSENAPGTVDNFLNYVEDGDYDTSIFHRLAFTPDNGGQRPFVLQGGGFNSTTADLCNMNDCTVDDVDPDQFGEIPTDPPIQNEPDVPNTRATVAMAKTSDPNSATSQFYINLGENLFLDDPNNSGGFTVFARVTDMTAVDAITDFERIGLSNLFPANSRLRALAEVPYQPSGTRPGNAEMVRIESVSGTSVISGKVFLDRNANGLVDGEEAGITGVRVYLDTDGDGQLGGNEPQMLTDVDGDYDFRVDPGQYTVRVAPVTDFQASTQNTRIDVAVGTGRTSKDADFGLRYSGLSWTNPLDPLDVDAVNGVTSRDALLIINEITLRNFSDPDDQGRLPALSSPPLDPFFFDVDPNDFVAPQDAIIVINSLPSNIPNDSEVNSAPPDPAQAPLSQTVLPVSPLVSLQTGDSPTEDSDQASIIDQIFAHNS